MSDLGKVLKFHWNQVDFQQTAGHYWKDIFGCHKKFESRKFVKNRKEFTHQIGKKYFTLICIRNFHNFINYKLFSIDWSVFSRSLGTSTECVYIYKGMCEILIIFNKCLNVGSLELGDTNWCTSIVLVV